ncbi:MAG: 50S ribosomal protein L35 [Planctomycetes bacterium]|nr:50S ribosomal protein L35 [Planctomycetota bacterium]
MSNKTHKGLKKRLNKSARGKVTHLSRGRRHLLSSKSGKRKRHLKGWKELSKGDLRSFERQYGKI